jgi:hypothetical protein
MREDSIFITDKQGDENSIGVRVRSMITKGFFRNLGEPAYLAKEKPEYKSMPKRRR